MNSIINKPRGQHPRSVKRMRILYRRSRDPLLTILLIIQIFLLFIMPPLRSIGLEIPHDAIYVALMLIVGLAIILSRSQNAMFLMIVSVVLTVTGMVWHQQEVNLLTDTLTYGGQVMTQIALLWSVSSAVFGSGRTTHHRILGAIVMYLGIGMIFTSLDLLLARSVASAFTHLPPLNDPSMRDMLNYFSFSTLTTGSFGDISPVHPIARSLANLESICGQLFPATLLARIVSLQGSIRKAGDGL